MRGAVGTRPGLREEPAALFVGAFVGYSRSRGIPRARLYLIAASPLIAIRPWQCLNAVPALYPAAIPSSA